ncbi:hypothetical protein DPEC_G00261610 [Dallia pectoralis]|uniref:Uncharacterized protein n=1 Tax=Dallia pectoralis TaxID=75939 RepID=A0ACC2FRN2_DALPE|nr:hypothetical protein DPEC_G00261610 [Dallia pectoralis]
MEQHDGDRWNGVADSRDELNKVRKHPNSCAETTRTLERLSYDNPRRTFNSCEAVEQVTAGQDDVRGPQPLLRIITSRPRGPGTEPDGTEPLSLPQVRLFGTH